MSVDIDMNKVTSETVQQLGGQLALATLELNAQRAAGAALQKRIDELESLAPKDVEPEEKPTEGLGEPEKKPTRVEKKIL